MNKNNAIQSTSSENQKHVDGCFAKPSQTSQALGTIGSKVGVTWESELATDQIAQPKKLRASAE